MSPLEISDLNRPIIRSLFFCFQLSPKQNLKLHLLALYKWAIHSFKNAYFPDE